MRLGSFSLNLCESVVLLLRASAAFAFSYQFVASPQFRLRGPLVRHVAVSVLPRLLLLRCLSSLIFITVSLLPYHIVVKNFWLDF